MTPAARRPGWRRRLRSASWYRRSKLLLKRLVGRDPWLAAELRCPLTRYGDWALDATRLKRGDVVYAAGVGRELGVELDLVRRLGVEVHAFDPSPESLRWVASQTLPPGLQFHALALSGSDGRLVLRARPPRGDDFPVMYSAVDDSRSGPAVEVECLTLSSLMARLGHRQLALLKLDIEGAEYAALDGMLAGPVRPAQVLVEFHHRFPTLGPDHTVRMVARLRAAGYRIAFIADTGREFSFIRP
jgi:FkbM family methyltransferase